MDYQSCGSMSSMSLKNCDPTDAHDDFFRMDIESMCNLGEPGGGESGGDTSEWIGLVERAEAGETVDAYYDCAGRDGMFEPDARFAVLDDADVDRLIALLVNRKAT